VLCRAARSPQRRRRALSDEDRARLLGSHGGGFLPREAVPRGTMPALATMRDGGDFCGFIEGDGDLERSGQRCGVRGDPGRGH